MLLFSSWLKKKKKPDKEQIKEASQINITACFIDIQ